MDDVITSITKGSNELKLYAMIELLNAGIIKELNVYNQYIKTNPKLHSTELQLIDTFIAYVCNFSISLGIWVTDIKYDLTSVLKLRDEINIGTFKKTELRMLSRILLFIIDNYKIMTRIGYYAEKNLNLNIVEEIKKSAKNLLVLNITDSDTDKIIKLCIEFGKIFEK